MNGTDEVLDRGLLHLAILQGSRAGVPIVGRSRSAPVSSARVDADAASEQCASDTFSIGLRRLDAMPAISRDEVAHLARLARLDLSEDELSHYAEQLDVILTAVTRVGEVAAQDVEPMSHPVALDNVFRADVLQPGLTAEEALSAAPAVEDGRFRVPRILDEE